MPTIESKRVPRQDLSRYGIRMPKYSDVIVKEKEHVSHQAWWIFYNSQASFQDITLFGSM
jgi:hypothetical protein